MEPDCPEIWEVPNPGSCGCSSSGVDLEDLGGLAYVAEKPWITENVDSGTLIEKDPPLVDELVS